MLSILLILILLPVSDFGLDGDDDFIDSGLLGKFILVTTWIRPNPLSTAARAHSRAVIRRRGVVAPRC